MQHPARTSRVLSNELLPPPFRSDRAIRCQRVGCGRTHIEGCGCQPQVDPANSMASPQGGSRDAATVHAALWMARATISRICAIFFRHAAGAVVATGNVRQQTELTRTPRWDMVSTWVEVDLRKDHAKASSTLDLNKWINCKLARARAHGPKLDHSGGFRRPLAQVVMKRGQMVAAEVAGPCSAAPRGASAQGALKAWHG